MLNYKQGDRFGVSPTVFMQKMFKFKKLKL